MGTYSEDYPELQNDATSRDRIVRSYAAQDAARARSARMYSQEASQAYKENAARARERAEQRQALDARRREEESFRAAQRAAQRDAEASRARSTASGHGRPYNIPSERIANPLTTQESHDQTRMSRDYYERARAARDVLSPDRQMRTANRELIDGRGSIDSRAFSERQQIVGYTIDENDRHEPMLDVNESKSRWRSQGSQDAGMGMSLGSRRPSAKNGPTIGFTGGVMSGQRNYVAPKSGLASIPLFVRIVVPIIIVLGIILFVILNP